MSEPLVLSRGAEGRGVLAATEGAKLMLAIADRLAPDARAAFLESSSDDDTRGRGFLEARLAELLTGGWTFEQLVAEAAARPLPPRIKTSVTAVVVKRIKLLPLRAPAAVAREVTERRALANAATHGARLVAAVGPVGALVQIHDRYRESMPELRAALLGAGIGPDDLADLVVEAELYEAPELVEALGFEEVA